MTIYVTFSVPLDRGPEAWERYAAETIQIGPVATEDDAWISLGDTIGDDRASLAHIVQREAAEMTSREDEIRALHRAR